MNLRDTKSQDRAAYAIQELLRVCGCDKNTTTTKSHAGQEIWKSFSDDVRQIILPFLSSTYELQTKDYQNTELPIYNNVKSFRMWIAHWVTHLIYKGKGSKEEIFKACRGVVKDD